MNSVVAERNCEHGGTPGECSGITARSNQTGSAAKVSQAQAQVPRDPGRAPVVAPQQAEATRPALARWM